MCEETLLNTLMNVSSTLLYILIIARFDPD